MDSSHIFSNTVYTQKVNPDKEWELGTPATAQFAFELNTMYGDLPEIQGKEFRLIVENKARGIFIAEKPIKKSDVVVSVTAYDRMGYFDIYVTEWLDSIQYPITLFELLQSLCDWCNVALDAANNADTVFNANYIIKEKPNAPNATGKQILRWICELAACFAIIAPDGKLQLRWYEETDLIIDGVLDNDTAEFETDKIELLQISSPYITVAVPDKFSTENVYVFSGNALMTESDEQELYLLGEKIFNRIKNITCRPFKISTFMTALDTKYFMTKDGLEFLTSDGENFLVAVDALQITNAGNIITIKPRKGAEFKTLVMSVTAYGTSFNRIELATFGEKARGTFVDRWAHFKYVKNIRTVSLIFIILFVIIFCLAAIFDPIEKEDIDNTEISSNSAITVPSDNIYENNNKKSFESILDYYVKKMQDATPNLIAEYKEESANNQDGVNGLYAIAEQKMMKLSEIAKEGVDEMGEFYLNNGSGKYSEYEEWFDKLQNIYIEETYKIEEVYYESVQ